MDLEIRTLEEDNKKIVQLIGEIDVYTASMLKDALNPFFKLANIELIIDLSQVQYMDSTGIGIFIRSLKSLNNNNSSMKIVGVNERIGRLFAITGLDEVLEIGVAKGEEI